MGFDLDTFLSPLLHKCISEKLRESGFSNARAPPSVDFRQSLKIQGLAFSSQGSVPPSSHLDLYFLRPALPPGAGTAWILVLALTGWVTLDKSLAFPIPGSLPINWEWIRHLPVTRTELTNH